MTYKEVLAQIGKSDKLTEAVQALDVDKLTWDVILVSELREQTGLSRSAVSVGGGIQVAAWNSEQDRLDDDNSTHPIFSCII
jgi:DNA-binding transcriptional regulator/RsmH inhibitor MraZ